MFAFVLLAASFLIQGVFGQYFWSYWSEGGGNFVCNNGPGGSYTARWSGNGGFVCGKGWNPGTGRYSGSYDPTGPGYMTIYGWYASKSMRPEMLPPATPKAGNGKTLTTCRPQTRNPLIEYYVIEAHGDLSPNEPWTLKGNFTFEEGTYEIYQSTRVNKPSIEGTRTFQQYWSVRTEQRTTGSVTMQRHFDEWAKVGMRLGRHDYQILATEGYTSKGVTPSGTSSLTVS
ncbi:hypothetical protein DL766_005883 [Monosporascus sp. MC13-8B]|uniref:endo-1,4-beta-xylanase n=1 Tax=Monosporascus cannonballus TaxID=155416 RepID=A0ABY0GQS8_9PEZI|nr:hypothetical protein DL762_010594 [Monosporascus cannonballus]RYO88876.1 hypothetical protein DL763_005839 [Monosporascus cannonballus]RYP28385.1 hypothetical protein DL766_005883 [Monosporascus sp. MC13-8B]